MKIVVVTYGTEGDTRPLAALCRGLMNAGHEPRLLADAATLGSAVALGVPSQALSVDIRAALSSKAEPSASSSNKDGSTDAAKALVNLANANAAAWMREVADATADCDVVVASALAAFVGLSVAESRDIPVIGTGFIPITPTVEFPSPFLPPHRIPRWLNRSSHRLVNELVWQALRKTTNAARASVCGSCDPNCEAIEEYDDSGRLQLKVQTIMPVEAGDELFIDYSLTADDGSPPRTILVIAAPRTRESPHQSTLTRTIRRGLQHHR